MKAIEIYVNFIHIIWMLPCLILRFLQNVSSSDIFMLIWKFYHDYLQGELNDLDDQTVLRCLKERFEKKSIYVSTKLVSSFFVKNIGFRNQKVSSSHFQTYASNVLIAINPFEKLEIYRSQKTIEYSNSRGSSPHIYDIGKYLLFVDSWNFQKINMIRWNFSKASDRKFETIKKKSIRIDFGRFWCRQNRKCKAYYRIFMPSQIRCDICRYYSRGIRKC